MKQRIPFGHLTCHYCSGTFIIYITRTLDRNGVTYATEYQCKCGKYARWHALPTVSWRNKLKLFIHGETQK